MRALVLLSSALCAACSMDLSPGLARRATEAGMAAYKDEFTRTLRANELARAKDTIKREIARRYRAHTPKHLAPIYAHPPLAPIYAHPPSAFLRSDQALTQQLTASQLKEGLGHVHESLKERKMTGNTQTQRLAQLQWKQDDRDSTPDDDNNEKTWDPWWGNLETMLSIPSAPPPPEFSSFKRQKLRDWRAVIEQKLTNIESKIETELSIALQQSKRARQHSGALQELAEEPASAGRSSRPADEAAQDAVRHSLQHAAQAAEAARRVGPPLVVRGPRSSGHRDGAPHESPKRRRAEERERARHQAHARQLSRHATGSIVWPAIAIGSGGTILCAIALIVFFRLNQPAAAPKQPTKTKEELVCGMQRDTGATPYFVGTKSASRLRAGPDYTALHWVEY